MKGFTKLIAILIVAILIISSVYVFYYFDNGNDNNNDIIPPSIDSVTRNTTGTTGKITTITASFSDNINVTEATIFYRSENSEEWLNESILSGYVNIEIPSNSDDDWYYYITINDEAGNGPIGEPSIDGSIYFTIIITQNLEDLVHSVFIEEATGEGCVYCPGVSELIHELFKSGNYNFYYVSMVTEHTKANDHLYNEYNLYGQPTVYIDGGFNVLLGGGTTKADVNETKYIEAIETAEKRNVPKIKVNITIEYTEEGEKFTTNVIVDNYEEEIYTGTLKVHLAEIISRWSYKTGSGGNIYNGFLDYIINEEISIEPNGKITTSKDWDLSGLDPENLIIIAVVFNSNSIEQYSNPDGDDGEKNPFNAYYADATDGAYVIPGGNLPPEVGISNPVKGSLHILGIPLLKTILGNTWLIGATKIVVNANDDSNVEKVEFYIDDELISTIQQAPYEYQLKRLGLLKSILFRKHTIKVIAYDDTGKTSSDEFEVLVRL
jgi:hypothetical protein